MSKQTRLQLVANDVPLPLPSQQPRAWEPSHDVQFYDSDDYLVTSVSGFLLEGIRAGQPLIVIATESHRRQFIECIRRSGTDPDGDSVTAAWLDARQTLASFMEGPAPNPELFEATVGDVFAKLVEDRRYLVVRAYGEMVDLLWKDGNIEGAIALEELWNRLAQKYSFSLLCSYAMGNFLKEAHTESFLRICNHHGRAIPTEVFTQADEAERLRQITVLQQRSRALETEVHHRREVEGALRQLLTQRRQLEEATRRSEMLLRDFLENAPEAIHWVGPDGTILWANRAELSMLGYSHEEFVGRNIAEFHVDKERVAELLTRIVSGEEIREFPAALIRRDGSHRQVLINSNGLFEDGEFVHTRCFTRDVTDLQ
jgi:PAS domain S-box-containing protein